MSVNRVQNSDISGYKHYSIGGAVVMGILAGNAARDFLPLSKGSISNARIQNIEKNSYDDAYQKMSNWLKNRGNLSKSEDAFVKIVENGDIKENFDKTCNSLKKISKEIYDDFQTINWLASQYAQRNIQTGMNREIKITKRLRPVLPYVIAGGLTFGLAAIGYNVINSIKSSRG